MLKIPDSNSTNHPVTRRIWDTFHAKVPTLSEKNVIMMWNLHIHWDFSIFQIELRWKIRLKFNISGFLQSFQTGEGRLFHMPKTYISHGHFSMERVPDPLTLPLHVTLLRVQHCTLSFRSLTLGYQKSLHPMGHTHKWPVLIVLSDNPLFVTSHPGAHRVQEFLITQGGLKSMKIERF